MPMPNGLWYPAAIESAARLAAVAPDRRTSALHEEALSRGMKPKTLRRVMTAARYVEHHAKSGVECLASVMAIEALILIEKRAPAHAAALRPKVFSGELKSRQVAALAGQERRDDTPRGMDRNWSGLAKSVCEIFLDGFLSFTGKRVSQSGKRDFFSVDVEVDLPDQKQAAIFFSPQLLYSAMNSQSFSRQMTLALAALASYDRVIVVLTTEAEKTTYRYVTCLIHSSIDERLLAIDHTPDKLELLD